MDKLPIKISIDEAIKNAKSMSFGMILMICRNGTKEQTKALKKRMKGGKWTKDKNE